jgi:hypothetical protein
MEPHDCHPEDLPFIKRAAHLQALALQFVSIYRRFPLAELLEEAGISLAEYSAFYEGQLSPTREEWMKLHKLLKLPPETILLLADDETPDSEYV